MQWSKRVFYVSVAASFLGLLALLGWTRFLLVEAWEFMGAHLYSLHIIKRYSEEGKTDKLLSLLSGSEIEMIQYATHRKVYYSFPDVLANRYWHHMEEYGLPVTEEQKFNAYMSNAMTKSWSHWRHLESKFVHYDSPWSYPRWETHWIDPFFDEWHTWSAEDDNKYPSSEQREQREQPPEGDENTCR